jgi:OOP family OmpA-OmpF porin
MTLGVVSSLGRRFAMALVLLGLAIPALAQSTAKASGKEEAVAAKYGVGRPMGDAYVASATVPADKSSLVVYRNPNAQQQSVMTVYINGSYHTSLMQAGFSKVCLAETNLDVRTRLRPVNQPVNIALDKNVSLTISKGQTQYVRVAELADGNTQMEVVSAKVAGNELKKTREQMHALSRVEGASPCEDRKTAEALDGVVLVAYIEFATGKSRLLDMMPADLMELDRLVEKLKAQAQNQALMRVQVVGYANDGDKKNPNKHLAELRARTVEDYIVSQGVKPKTLKSEVRAEKNSLAPSNKSNSVVVVSASVEQP